MSAQTIPVVFPDTLPDTLPADARVLKNKRNLSVLAPRENGRVAWYRHNNRRAQYYWCEPQNIWKRVKPSPYRAPERLLRGPCANLAVCWETAGGPQNDQAA